MKLLTIIAGSFELLAGLDLEFSAYWPIADKHYRQLASGGVFICCSYSSVTKSFSSLKPPDRLTSNLICSFPCSFLVVKLFRFYDTLKYSLLQGIGIFQLPSSLKLYVCLTSDFVHDIL